MRITQHQLRQIIREVLASDMPDLRGPAISVIPWGSRTFVIAYDTELLLLRMHELDEMGINTPSQYVTSWFAPDFSRDPEMIFSGVALAATAAEGPCNGAMHVEGSASRIRGGGWGTAVYMAALEQFGEVGPDRASVSPGAEALWKSLDRRAEVERHPYDDIRAPMTPNPNDDCTVRRGRDPQVNSSYRLLDEPALAGLSEMRALGDAVQASLGDRWILAEQMLLKLWNEVFQANFGR